MEVLQSLLHGLSVAIQPGNLLFAGIGVLLGTLVGILPGISPSLTVALLLPVTFKLDPTGSIIMFAGIYFGGMYGSSTTAILLNTPGEAASIATAIEGHKMARAGRGGPALATAAIGSFVAGTLATIGLALLAPTHRRSRGRLRPVGLLRPDGARLRHHLGDLRQLGAARPDQPGARPRARPGRHRQAHRPGAAGLRRAVAARRRLDHDAGGGPVRDGRGAVRGVALHRRARDDRGGARVALDDARRLAALLEGRGCAASASAFRSARCRPAAPRCRRCCRTPSSASSPATPNEFGKGAIEGVAGPEAANNAAATGTLVPLLALGLPTSATAAMLLAGFQQYGLVPGPLLFVTNTDLVWGLIASFFIGNLMLLVLNLPLVGLWVKLLTVPQP